MHQKNKFCLLTTQRSGSTWLSTLLDSHPQIKAFEEPFIWRKDRPNWQEKSLPTYYNYKNSFKGSSLLTLSKYLDLLNSYSDERKNINTIGFKLMYSQIKENPEVLIKLILDKYRIVHLVRCNYLDILISRASLEQNRIAHSKEIQVKTKQVILNPLLLIEELNQLEKNYKFFRTVLKLMPLPVLEITYESLQVNRKEVLELIANFVQVDSTFAGFQSELKRVNRGAYQEKISNYAQVVETLKSTKYANLISLA